PAQAEVLNAARQQTVGVLDREIAAKELAVVNLEGNLELDAKWPSSWKHDADAKLIATSSSPFINVFPAGTQCVQLPNSPKNLGFRRPLAAQTQQTQKPLYFNLDFRNVSVEAGGEGYYRIALDHPTNHFS